MSSVYTYMEWTPSCIIKWYNKVQKRVNRMGKENFMYFVRKIDFYLCKISLEGHTTFVNLVSSYEGNYVTGGQAWEGNIYCIPYGNL